MRGREGANVLPPCALLGDQTEVEPSSAHCEQGMGTVRWCCTRGAFWELFCDVQRGRVRSVLNRTNGGMLYILLE